MEYGRSQSRTTCLLSPYRFQFQCLPRSWLWCEGSTLCSTLPTSSVDRRDRNPTQVREKSRVSPITFPLQSHSLNVWTHFRDEGLMGYVGLLKLYAQYRTEFNLAYFEAISVLAGTFFLKRNTEDVRIMCPFQSWRHSQMLYTRSCIFHQEYYLLAFVLNN